LGDKEAMVVVRKFVASRCLPSGTENKKADECIMCNFWTKSADTGPKIFSLATKGKLSIFV
jgi:hypothetical protein